MKLTAQHHKAIELIVSGINGKNAAEKIGVTQETISRWRSDFDFQAALNAMLKTAQQESKDKLRYLSGIALSTIEEIMLDTEAPYKERLTASLKILEIVDLKTSSIGSTNTSVLEKEDQQYKSLESYLL